MNKKSLTLQHSCFASLDAMFNAAPVSYTNETSIKGWDV